MQAPSAPSLRYMACSPAPTPTKGFRGEHCPLLYVTQTFLSADAGVRLRRVADRRTATLCLPPRALPTGEYLPLGGNVGP